MIDRSQAPAPAAIRAFEFPAVDRRVLDSGMTVLSARAGDLPLVTVRAVIDAGASAEGEGEEGLAWLTSKALAGGTTDRSGVDLAWDLERLGTELETAVGWDGLHVQLTVTTDHIGAALDILAEIVREPAFPEREVDRLRAEQLAEILRRSTEPRALADDSAARWIFADDQPYGRSVLGIDERVQSFDRDAVDTYHRRRFTPGNTAIVVVGAVDAAAAVAEVERAFHGWTGAREAAPLPSTRARPERTTLYMVDRPSAVQSELRIGHVGVPRHHEDYYPLLVMNAIVAGAFTSRLNLSLREKHGFTYGVRSTFVFRRAAGPFIIQTAVGSDVTARAVEEALRELKTLQADGVTDDEVTAARDFLAGTLPLEMQTTEQLATRLADLHTFELPTDTFENHRALIQAVTRADVERVAREYLRLDQLAVVVVGNAAAVEEDVQSVLDGAVESG